MDDFNIFANNNNALFIGKSVVNMVRRSWRRRIWWWGKLMNRSWYCLHCLNSTVEFFPLLQNYFSTFLHKNNPLLERDYSPLGPLILSWGIKKSFFSFLTVLIVHLLFSTKVFAAVVQLFTYACHVGSFVKLFYISIQWLFWWKNYDILK